MKVTCNVKDNKYYNLLAGSLFWKFISLIFYSHVYTCWVIKNYKLPEFSLMFSMPIKTLAPWPVFRFGQVGLIPTNSVSLHCLTVTSSQALSISTGTQGISDLMWIMPNDCVKSRRYVKLTSVHVPVKMAIVPLATSHSVNTQKDWIPLFIFLRANKLFTIFYDYYWSSSSHLHFRIPFLPS